jgi:hypothetical protein
MSSCSTAVRAEPCRVVNEILEPLMSEPGSLFEIQRVGGEGLINASQMEHCPSVAIKVEINFTSISFLFDAPYVCGDSK